MSVSDKILDNLIPHEIDLRRFEESERRKVLRLLRDMEREIIARINEIDPTEPTRATFIQRRTEKLLEVVRDSIRTHYAGIEQTWAADMRDLVRLEAETMASIVNQAFRVELFSVAFGGELVRTIVSDTLIEGARSKDWWSEQRTNLRKRFERQVRIGVAAGEGAQKIARRIRALNRDGMLGEIAKTRREAEALVRTSVQTISNATREEVLKQNKGWVKAIQWRATLDGRTTKICIALDGLQWELESKEPIGHSQSYPGPTSHWNCRSTQIPVVKGWEEKEQDYEREFRKSLGERWDRSPSLQDRMPREAYVRGQLSNSRASIDGQVSADVDYLDWLAGKDVAFQNRVLGPTRATMFRKGKLTRSELISQTNRPLTIAEIRAKKS